MDGKIAIEEHFVPAGMEELVTNPGWSPEAWQATLDRLTDVDARLAEMDRNGIEMVVLSLASNGIQDVLDPGEAHALAVRANDALAALVAEHPTRFVGFAALPMEEPLVAAQELERAVRELGLKGALVNGYTSVGTLDEGRYYDDERFDPFWARVEALDVPSTCTRATRCRGSGGSTTAARSCSGRRGRSAPRRPCMRCA